MHLKRLSLAFLPVLLLAALPSRASTILLAPANPTEQTTGLTNDGYAGGRGVVFLVDQDFTLTAAGFRGDLSNADVTYTIQQVPSGSPLDDSGATLLSTGQQFFSSTGGQFNTFTFTPVSLLAGKYYEVQFSFPEAATTNYYYRNNNVRFTAGPFSGIDGTASGNWTNTVLPEIQLSGSIAATPEPSALILLSTGLASLSLIARRRIL